MAYEKNSKGGKDEEYTTKDQPKRGNRGNRSARRSSQRGGRSDRRSTNRSNSNGAVPPAVTGSFNDLGWYAHYPLLLASAAMLAFPNKPGMDLKLDRISFIDFSGDIAEFNDARLEVPGILQMHYEYTIGWSDDVTSAASIAAKEMWGTIRSKFSSNLGYDAPDLFMYILAIDQIHSYIAYLKRIYRVSGVYSSQNYLMPETLMDAVIGVTSDPQMGQPFDYNVIIRNRVKLWNYINTLVHMVNKFTCPFVYDLFNRHRWMNEHVYADAPTIQSQLYVFVPRHFWFIDDTSETGTMLFPMDIPDVGSDAAVDNMYNYGVEMIQRLSNWEDAYTINGHLMRAFDGVNQYVAAELLQDEIIQVDFVPEVLSQIHNLTVVDNFTQAAITQDPDSNSIIYTPSLREIHLWNEYKSVLDLDTIAPSPAEVTLATRLAAMAQGGKLICGTEVITGLYLYTKHPFADVIYSRGWIPIKQMQSIDFRYIEHDNRQYMHDLIAQIYARGVLRTFWKAPMLFQVYNDTDEEVYPITLVPSNEMTNATVFERNFLADLHRVCLYSEFNCFGGKAGDDVTIK